ncbi:MAG: S-layer homology domain-containing protein [Acutalibacter sp.]
MLVVAMIPLSAAAVSLPALDYLIVGSTKVEVENGTLNATYPEDATTVSVSTVLDSNVNLYALQADGTHKELLNSNGTASSITLTNYTPDSEDVYTITLVVESTTSGKYDTDKQEYTLVLTPYTPSTTFGVEKVEVTDDSRNEGILGASYDASKKNVEVTVAYGYDANAGQIRVTPDAKSRLNSSTAGLGVAGMVNVPAEGTTGTFDIYSEGGEKIPWTITVTEAPVLQSLSVAGHEGVFSDENKDGKNDTINVTVALDDIKDNLGFVQDHPSLEVTLGALANTSLSWSTSGTAGATPGTLTAGQGLTSGTKLTFTRLGVTDGTSNQVANSVFIQVQSGDSSSAAIYEYELKVQVEKISDTAIMAAYINDVEAKIDGTNISAVLDAGTTGAQPLRIHVVKNATVSGAGLTHQTSLDTNEYDVWANTSGTSFPAVISVKAPDSLTAVQYTLSYTAASEQTAATMTSFTLQAPDGTQYTTTIDQVKHTITTVDIPYMTTSIADWTMYAFANEGARAEYVKAGGNIKIMNNVTKFRDLTGANYGSTPWDDGADQTVGTIRVLSQGSTTTTTDYTLIVKFADPSKDNTLKSMDLTALLTSGPSAPTSDRDIVRQHNDTNTFTGKFNTLPDPDEIDFEFAYSQGSSTHTYYLYDIATNGGVAYKWDGSKVYELSTPDVNDNVNKNTSSFANDNEIIVLPEAVAKKYAAAMSGGSATWSATDLQYATRYSLNFTNKEASTEGKLNTIKVGDTTLIVDSNGIHGTIPYSMTVAADATGLDEYDAYFLDYTVSDYAEVYNKAGKIQIVDDGDTNFDGVAEGASSTNGKLLFVRNNDAKHTVKVVLISSTTVNPADPETAALGVWSEDAVSKGVKTGNRTNAYDFDLTWADPGTEAKITSFKLGNTSGTISGNNINVTLPFGSNLMSQLATFTTSTGAEVTVGGAEIKSGETLLNVSGPVVLTVKSEDGKVQDKYTLTVKVAEQFSDVQPDDWFYDNVMRAVELGIAKGKGNGTFDPYGQITRRDFAIMLAQAMGQSNDGEAVSPFPDVADNDYGVVSIKYLYDQKITVGDSDGNFNPDANITRQEVAIMLAKAFGATGTTDTVFTDDAKIASWAKDYVYAAKAAGLMNGDTAGTFRPNDSFTRAEAASAMVNAIDK